MDFIVANGDTNDLWVYLGNGDGTFQLPRIVPLTKGLSPVYMAAGDLRGNGTLDLVMAEFDTSTIGVLLGNGDGTFGYEQIYSLPQPPGAVVLDDFNQDGKLDIAAVMVTVNPPMTLGVPYIAALFGDGTGNFTPAVISSNPGFYSSALTIASGDVNNDGLPDLLITGPGLENSQIYINDGAGSFSPGQTVIGNSPFTVELAGTLGDINGDGCADALTADLDGDVWVAMGNCSGSFSHPVAVPMGDSAAAIKLADVNGDGHLDIVTTAIPLAPGFGDVAGNMLAVALGDGHGNFSVGRDYVGTGMSYSLAIADFNGDGRPDVVSASPDTDTATVYINDGSGGFGFPQGEWIGLPGIGILNAPLSPPSFVDLNGDGKPDMVLLDEGYNGEYLITTMLNDGTGRFAGPAPSDTGINIISDWMGDYRLGDFRHTGHQDFVGIGLGLSYTAGTQYILFAPGNGDGTFGKATFIATPGAEGAMGVGDFNGDGKLDFAAVGANPNGAGWTLSVFLGNGDGSFRNASTLNFADSAADLARVFVGDFNRDGKLDLLVYDTGNGYFTTNSYVWEFIGNGNGTFQAGEQLFSAFQPMTLADVNGDSWPDIVRYDFFWPDGTTETYGPPKFTTYLGQSSGAFLQTSSYAPYAGVPEQADPYLQFGDPLTSSKVADLNGDGKLDEVAFQRATESNGDVYAQILLGNGDGTFIPTYDVFDFQKNYYFPGYVHILDATLFSDLVEVDAATSSMHVFKGGPAPGLQLALEETQINGTSGCGWVFLNMPSTSDTSVTLSTNVSGVALPASVTFPANSISQQFCFTLDSSYDWHQVIDIRATLGSTTAIAYASQSYIVGFSESISPSTDQAVYPTQSTAPVTVTVTSSQGYSSTLSFSCQGLPVGANCAFGSPVLTLPANSTASTTVVVNTSNSGYSSGLLTILAGDANIIKRQSFNLTVQPLTVTPVGQNPSATSPGSGGTNFVINGISPYQLSCAGLPAGVTCSFSSTGSEFLLTVNVPAGIAVGAYPFTVNVVSGPFPASLSYTLNISDFSLLAPTAAQDWALPGSNVNVSLGAQSLGGFFGELDVSCTSDFGATCTGGSYPVIPSLGVSPINLSLSVPSTIAPGQHSLSVTATSGSLQHVLNFPFYVADYSGSIGKSSLTMSAGSSSTVTATVTATTGFAGTISFACTGNPSVLCSFTPSTVTPTAAGAQTTLTVTAGAGASHFSAAPKSGWFIIALVLPLGFITASQRRLRTTVIASVLLLSLLLTFPSCGGSRSSSNGGGSGSVGPSHYIITVTASANGTNTTRTLGTINVTVTH